jgi:hypothetical protein
MKGRVAVLALLVGCGSRTTLSTRDASPFVDDDPFLKLDGGAGPGPARALDGGGGSTIGPAAEDGPSGSSATGERALRDIAKLLWQAEPDPRHLALARSGQLRSSADLEPIVREMVADERSAVGVGGFFRWWLGLEELKGASKDPQLFPLFSQVADALGEDVVRFGVEVTRSDGRFSTLMTAARPYQDMSVAALVGDGGDDPRRAGLLGRPGLLALHARAERASPVKRGLFVREDLLCQAIPAVPPDVDTRVPPQPAGLTNREQYASLMISPACLGCHALIDDIGYGLENFDAVGAFRLIDHGRMVDASGVLRGARGDRSFNGAAELGKLLASDPGAQDCIVSKWFHYLRGAPAQSGDRLLARARDAFGRSGGDMREVIVTVLGAAPLN